MEIVQDSRNRNQRTDSAEEATAGSLTVTNPTTNPVATIENPVPVSLYPGNPIFNVVSIPEDRKRHNAYMQNFNFQLSLQFTSNDVLEAGWAGVKALMWTPA